MKILLIGGTGNIGQRILKEALLQGNQVHAVQRHPDGLNIKDDKLTVSKGDIMDKALLNELLKNADVVVSAISPTGGLTPEQFKKANSVLIDAVKKHPSVRAIIVGGAGSTEVSPGLRMMDSPVMDKLPAEWKPAIFVHAEVLDLYKASDIDWTYFSPASHITPGERTGKYRLGGTNMIFDTNGESHI